MKRYPPKEEVCRAMMEFIFRHLVDPTSESLSHHALCERANVNVKARDSVSYLKDLWLLCLQNNCPNLAILVVNQKKKLPGDWYFELYEAMHPGVMYHRGNHNKLELEKIYSYQDWHVIAERYGLSENLVLQLKLRRPKLKER